jgi:cytochrome c-type biogenesis protein CcmE
MSAASRQPSPAPMSAKTAWKIVLSVVAAVLAVGGVFYSSMAQDMALYKMVDEVMAAPAEFQGKKIQVHGWVVQDSILNKPGTLEYKFQLETRAPRKPAVVEVTYKGIVPDTFKSGAEVVATGTLDPKNALKAGSISAKCPSKYDAKEPELLKTSSTGAAPAGY